MGKGVISHHFRASKKVERLRTAHIRKRLRCCWARFILMVALWCAQACWALLEVALQCKSSAGCCSTWLVQIWVRAGMRMYKAGRCGNDGVRPI